VYNVLPRVVREVTSGVLRQSGTGVLADKADGNYLTDKIYTDTDIPMIESLPKTQPHRDVELAVVAADEEGNFRCASLSMNDKRS